MKPLQLIITSFFSITTLSIAGQDTSNRLTSEASHAAKAADFQVNSASAEAVAAFNQGLYWLDVGDQKKALSYLQTAIDHDANLASAYLYKAQVEPTFEGFTSSLQQAKSHLSTASDWDKLYYGILETRLTDDQDKHLSNAQELVSKYPNIARSYHELGNAYTDKDEVDKARESYKKAVEVAPDWVVGHYDLANSYVTRDPKDLKEAETHAQHAVSLAPNSTTPYIVLGDVYRAQNQWDKSEASYTKAIALDTKDVVAYTKRGHVNNFAGKYDEARKDYALAGQYDVTSPAAAVIYTAYTYAYQGDLAKAIQILRDEATKLKNASLKGKAGLQYDLLQPAAVMAFHEGDAKTLNAVIDQWEPVYIELAETGGTDEMKRYQKADMLYWRGMAEVLIGNYQKARVHAEEMKSLLDPINNPHKLDNYNSLLGHINYRQNNFKEAAAHFDQTNKVDTYSKYWMAKAADKAGDKDKAQKLYQELANYNFNDVGNAVVRSEVKKMAGKE